MKRIYLDNAATTYVRSEVMKEMLPYFDKKFGNPGSMHSYGLEAKKVVEESRNKIAKILNCESKEVIFTASGTESINLAIKGFVRANKLKGKHIITSQTEHHAVLETCKHLESEGFEITYLKPDKHGVIQPDVLEKEIRKDTILISIMYANNEIGTINPIKKLTELVHKHNIIFHTDACQAAGFLDINVKNLGIDLMTVNGSKIYAPKGIGLLYIRKGIRLNPIIHGGGQEFGLRSGTENIPYIVAIAKALELAQKEKTREVKRLTKLRDKLVKYLLKISKTFLNGHPKQRLPNNVNITIFDVEGESVLLMLNEKGICASTGSACTSKNLEPSHVLTSIGLSHGAAHGSLRFTLGRKTTENDINKVIKVLPNIVEKLRNISSVKINETVK